MKFKAEFDLQNHIYVIEFKRCKRPVEVNRVTVSRFKLNYR